MSGLWSFIPPANPPRPLNVKGDRLKPSPVPVQTDGLVDTDLEVAGAGGVGGHGGTTTTLSKMTRDFSQVVITLDNVLIPEDKLTPTPSQVDGLTEETEMDLRVLGTEMIQTAGILLSLPQVSRSLSLLVEPS